MEDVLCGEELHAAEVVHKVGYVSKVDIAPFQTITRITCGVAAACSLGVEQVIMLLAPPSNLHFRCAVWLWAHPECTVLGAEPVRFCGGGTIGCLASFESGSTVLLAESSCVCFVGAAWMYTHRSWSTATVFVAESTCVRAGGAAWMHTHTL
jgi:hypothetical protein